MFTVLTNDPCHLDRYGDYPVNSKSIVVMSTPKTNQHVLYSLQLKVIREINRNHFFLQKTLL